MRAGYTGAAALIGTLLLACLPLDGARAKQEQPDGPLLSAVVVNGREVAVADVMQLERRLWVPLPAFATWTGATLEEADGAYRLHTSLGPVEVGADELRILDGVPHVSQQFLERSLAVRVAYNEERLALTLDFPWGPVVEPGQVVRPAAEVKAPGASLSIVREDFGWREVNGLSSVNSSSVVAGRLAGGRFRVRYDTVFEGSGSFTEAAWSRNVGPAMLMAGYQNVLVNPLMGAGAFTGVQGAWTNQPFDLFPQDAEGRELLPRRVTPRRTFRGRGPVAGRAVLRADGVALAQMTIGLDGLWEFLEVTLPARTAIRVEVHLYSRENQLVPVAIEEQTVSLSDMLLPKGAVVALGGGGAAGNLLTEAIGGSRGYSGGLGFASARFGVTQGLTMEASGQVNEDRWQGLVGFTAGLGRTAALGFSAATGNGGSAYRADLSWVESRFRLVGFSQVREESFLAEGSIRDVEHYGETSYRLSPGVELALVGRDRRYGDIAFQFLRPGVTLRLLRGVVARAWPDYDGTYRYDLFARVGSGTLVAATYSDYARIDVSANGPTGWRFSAGTEFAGDQATRISGVAHWRRSGTFPFEVSGGPVWSAGKWGLYASAFVPVFWGLFLNGEVQTVPLSRSRGSEVSPVVYAGLSASLGVAGGRLVPAESGPWRSGRGGIAGQIRVKGASGAWNLADVALRVEDQVLTRTLPGGAYFVANLPEGVYTVELDDERLPIELVPVRKRFVVEVISGAVTRVDFTVHPQFSVAGRVSCSDTGALKESVVELLDGNLKTVTATQADSFGLYRLDGVRPGAYTLRAWLPGKVGEPVTRAVSVTNDFLFGVDVTIACPPAPPDPETVTPD